MHAMPTFQSFHAHVAIALNLIALVSGVLLVNKAKAEGFFCKKTGQIVGGAVMILSILSTLCVGYLAIRRCCARDEMTKMMWQHPAIEMPGQAQEAPAPPKEP